MKFRARPIVVEAIQWTGKNEREVREFAGDAAEFWDGVLYIGTAEGEMIAFRNDWIIKGIKGEFYPCMPDVFDSTYEAVEEK